MIDESKSNAVLRSRFPTTKSTIEYASKFILRTIPQAEYWITNRHRWMHNIPTEECDVVITVSVGIEDETVTWLLTRFRGKGLQVQVRHNPLTNCYQCYLTATTNILLKCAEEYHLPKRLNAEFGGGLKEFVRSDGNKFEGYENEAEFFTMQERQWLILRLLETLRTYSDEEVGNVKFIQGQAIISKCTSCGIIAQIYPVHEMQTLKYLRKTWVRSVFNRQPIDDVAEYFGVKIAMYFAWLEHYTRALTIPAVVGFIFWIISFCRISQTVSDTGFVLFSFFNVIWFSIYLEAWKRYCSELAYKWGTLDQRDELLVEPRPLFRGPLKISPVTGRLEPKYPSWKRNIFRYLVSIPVMGVCIIIVVGIMILSFKLQDWWDKRIVVGNFFQCFTFLPKILLGIVISFLDDVYYKVACWLNDEENNRLNREYENNLIVKVVTFQFVNSFISLFYIAFYLQDQERLKVQLAVLLITRQILRNIKESALPYLIEQFRLAKLSFDIFGALSPTVSKEKFWKSFKSNPKKKHTESSTIPQAEVESTLFKYEGTFSEHQEMFMQLGYVVLFSSAFPMAAFCAFINNLLEIRSDAFKMCFIYQRPFGERVSNIGMWLNMMEIMGLIAILVNCTLIGLSGQVHRMFPDISKTQIVLLIVALEHLMLAIRFLTSCLIPDKPNWVATEMAKVEFARREALNRLSTTTTPPPTATTDNLSLNLSCDIEDGVYGAVLQPTPTSERLNDGSSDGSCHFEIASEGQTGDEVVCSVESELYQSVDNIDRILRNINEKERENLSVLGKHLSRESQSSEDNAELTATHLASKLKVKHFPVAMKNIAVSVDHLNRVAHRDRNVPVCVNNKLIAMSNLDKNSTICRSASCISSSQKDSKGIAVTPNSVMSRSRILTLMNKSLRSLNKRDSAGSETSSVTEKVPLKLSEKKKKLRSALIKRVRCVTVFPLKLKEKRSKFHSKDVGKQKQKISPCNEGVMVGGELSCVPIEMLISMDDVNTRGQQSTNNIISSRSQTSIAQTSQQEN